jgi:hypothetical protein
MFRRSGHRFADKNMRKRVIAGARDDSAGIGMCSIGAMRMNGRNGELS